MVRRIYYEKSGLLADYYPKFYKEELRRKREEKKEMTQTGLLKATEVAEMMGISLRAVYRLKDTKKIPCIKWDRSVRFERADIENFIKNNRQEV